MRSFTFCVWRNTTHKTQSSAQVTKLSNKSGAEPMFALWLASGWSSFNFLFPFSLSLSPFPSPENVPDTADRRQRRGKGRRGEARPDFCSLLPVSNGPSIDQRHYLLAAPFPVAPVGPPAPSLARANRSKLSRASLNSSALKSFELDLNARREKGNALVCLCTHRLASHFV